MYRPGCANGLMGAPFPLYMACLSAGRFGVGYIIAVYESRAGWVCYGGAWWWWVAGCGSAAQYAEVHIIDICTR